MSGTRKHHATPPAPDAPACARYAALLPLRAHGLLDPADEELLAAHVAECTRCQAELAAYARLDAVLRHTFERSAADATLTNDILAHLHEAPEDDPRANGNARDRGARPPQTTRRAGAVATLAAALVVALIGALLLRAHGASSGPPQLSGILPAPTATIHYDADQFYTGGPVGDMRFTPASDRERDPRTIFATHLRLQICPGPPVEPVSVTWLAAGPGFGLALVGAACGVGTHNVALISLTLPSLNGQVCPTWSASANITARPKAGGPEPTVTPDATGARNGIPGWLPLPTRPYISQGVTPGPLAPSVYTDWLYSDATYATGRFLGVAYLPADAARVSIGGRPGLETTQGTSTIVTVPLSGGQTFFFAGTAPAAQVEALGSTVLAHLDALLPSPATGTPPDGLSC